jgi:hypothetical protein
MKKLLPLALLALLLSACSDSKIPKPPPKVPEPKLVTSAPSALCGASPALLAHGSAMSATSLRRS